MIIEYTTYSECKIDEDNILDYFVSYWEKDKVSAEDILEEVRYDGTRYRPMFTSFSYDDEDEEVYDKNELKALVDRINKAIAKKNKKMNIITKIIDAIEKKKHKSKCWDDNCPYCDKKYGYCKQDKEMRFCPFFSTPDWCPILVNKKRRK